MWQLFFCGQTRRMQNNADRAIIEVTCFYLLRTIQFWLRVVVWENKTNPKQTALCNVWNDFIHREYFSIRVRKIFLFIFFYAADATPAIQFLAEGSLTRLRSFSIFAISFSGPLAFSWNREKRYTSVPHIAQYLLMSCRRISRYQNSGPKAG